MMAKNGGPLAYVGHLTFQKKFWSKSPLWGPKTWSNKIKHPQVFHKVKLNVGTQSVPGPVVQNPD